MKKKEILIYGIGTYKNRGVEAIINSTINQINKDYYDVVIGSYDFLNNSKMYKNEIKKYINHYKTEDELSIKEKEYINKLYQENASKREIELFKQKELVNEIKNADICISAGGDNYCYGVSDWLYAIDEKVKQENKKLVLWGASLYEELEDEELIHDMDLFDVLLIRESLSYKALKKYISEDKLILAPDPAFSLESEKVELNDFYKQKNVVGINLSPITIPNPKRGDARFDEIIDLINYILNSTEFKVSLIPHVNTDGCDDLTTLNAVYQEFKENDRVYLEDSNYNCRQIKYIISNCKMMIAARTHASIAAYSTCVPTLVIGYSVKSKGIATDLFGTDNNYVLPSDTLCNGILVEKFIWLNDNKKKIKNRLNNIMPKIREDASNLFDKVVNRLETQEKKNICSHNNCIGCGLCVNSCKNGAIIMKEDELGYRYPVIDSKKCINCGLCKKICPINQKKLPNKFTPICYAAKNKNDSIRTKSTSGGVFSLLAETVLSKKGVVYGATQENLKVKHIRIDNKKDLEKIMGSKYAQSSLLEVFENIKKDKENGKFILLSGTPCQIGMFKSYLKDYEKVLYVSVICHGVINEKLTERYLKEEFKNQNIKKFEYRTKDNGWSISSVKIETDQYNRIEKFSENSLMGLYIFNSILRKSCYNCKFKGKNNHADIVLGDYWGVYDFHKELYDEKGVSALIVNSDKGKEFINKNSILKKLTCVKSDINNLKLTNPMYFEITKIPYRRYTIAKDFENLTLGQIYSFDLLKEQLKQEQKRLNEIIEMERTKRIEASEELSKIYNSKRWVITNKIFNFINKFRVKKK